ncbi:PGF-CTERM sorting domain-containing protein [Natronorubrum sp. DTA7]|uniref:PGF-CTERM sorting domain-containing protein n=1 Tax=Natronorubrum sp. DTA7 TaxID=3447016 RepID=UPI003F87687A
MSAITNERIGSIGLTAIVLVAMTLGTVAMPVAAQEDVDSRTMDITVSEDGSVERMEVAWGMDEETYEEYEMYAEWEGYEQVDDWFESLYEEEDWIGDSSVTTTEIDGGYALSIELVDVDTSEEPQVNIEIEEQSVIYEEFDVPDPAEDPDITESTHRVNMPGEITDSNADEVDGNVAVWNHHDEHTDELFAQAALDGGIELEVEEETETNTESADDESETETNDEGDDGTDTEDDTESTSANDGDDGDDDSMPGFGGAVALAALCLAALLTGRRRLDSR